MNQKYFKILIALTLLLGSPDYAQSVYSKGALEGLDIISEVLVEDLDTDLKNDGLEEKFIKTIIELKLRLAGITVGYGDINKGLNTKSTISLPVLNIGITSLKNNSLNLYALSIILMLREDVKLQYADNKIVRATIWQASITSVKPASKVKEIEDTIRNLCDIFINDYLNENPKR